MEDATNTLYKFIFNQIGLFHLSKTKQRKNTRTRVVHVSYKNTTSYQFVFCYSSSNKGGLVAL